MTGKTVGIGVVVIIIVALGAYIIFNNPFGAPQSAAQQQSAATTTAAEATTTVQAQDVTIGTGTQATPGSVVAVLYIGKLPDGTVFDSSAAHGNQPLSFTLGTQGLIPGFQIGVNGMKVGGERLLAVPPALGYGAQAITNASGTTIIPANSTLVFDVKLVSVKAGSTTPAAAPAK